MGRTKRKKYTVRYKHDRTLYVTKHGKTYNVGPSHSTSVFRFSSRRGAEALIRKVVKRYPELENMLEVAYNL